ncbi:MAG: WecB/TagA/CpsF family glycosyltransferase [Bacteroidota bacterium]
MRNNRKQILSLSVNYGTYKQFIDEIILLSIKRQSSYVCVANVHMLVEAHNDKVFQDIVNGADMVTPDGMPLVKVFKSLHGIVQDRVAGMNMLPDLLKEAEANNVKVYFYGGTQKMLDLTNEYCKKAFPLLNVVGLINNSGAQLVFVALGCPKQERWMASMRGKINAAMVGVGGALPVMIGLQKRAPLIMQKLSLEWLFRLGQEPKRLMKRYMVTNTTFIVLFGKAYFAKLRNKNTAV